MTIDERAPIAHRPPLSHRFVVSAVCMLIHSCSRIHEWLLRTSDRSITARFALRSTHSSHSRSFPTRSTRLHPDAPLPLAGRVGCGVRRRVELQRRGNRGKCRHDAARIGHRSHAQRKRVGVACDGRSTGAKAGSICSDDGAECNIGVARPRVASGCSRRCRCRWPSATRRQRRRALAPSRTAASFSSGAAAARTTSTVD